MEAAPAADQQIISDPAWQAAFTRGICEALAPGVDGWLDEVLAIAGDWPDVDPTAVACSVTWWHGDADRNCPLSAAQRLVGRLPDARLIVSTGTGHLVADGGEGEILDELLARARPAVTAG
jgi:pimeloyl-ACP methyl ester carboxylesterase